MGSKILELNPIESISVPGIGNLQESGLLVLVGPNASGKTQLLKDIHNILVGQKRELVVAEEINIKAPNDFDSFLDKLQEEGYITRTVDNNGNIILKKVAHGFGIGGGTGDLALNTAKSHFAQFKSATSEKTYEHDLPPENWTSFCVSI